MTRTIKNLVPLTKKPYKPELKKVTREMLFERIRNIEQQNKHYRTKRVATMKCGNGDMNIETTIKLMNYRKKRQTILGFRRYLQQNFMYQKK